MEPKKVNVFHPTPFIPITIFYIFGLVIGYHFVIPVLCLYIFALAIFLAAIFLKRYTLVNILLLLCITFIGILNYTLKTTNISPHHIKHLVGQKVELIGSVANDPEYVNQKWIIIVRTEKVIRPDNKSVTGMIRISAYNMPDFSVTYGDRIKILCKIRAPYSFKNPGVFDYPKYLARNGLFVIASVFKTDEIQIIGEGDTNPIFKLSYSVKKRIKTVIYQTLSGTHAAFLDGILLGNKTSLPKEVKDWFFNTGTIHILAVSGLNVALIAGFFFFLFRFLRLNQKTANLLNIAILIIFAIITGATPSVLRATVMAIIVLTGGIIDRDLNIYHTLSFACLLILVVTPNSLFDIGFQLSYLATLSIVYLSPIIINKLPIKPRWVSALIGVSISAQIGVTPILFYYFGQCSIITLIANLFVVPLAGIILPLGGITFFVSFLWIGIAKALAMVNYLCITILLYSVSYLAKLPYGLIYLPSPPWWILVGYYLIILLLTDAFRIGRKGIIISLALLNIFVISELCKHKDVLTVSFLDVGQGDATFIQFPKGGTLLIDGGKEDVGEWVLIPFLNHLGIHSIDTVVITHPDIDHFGGLFTVIKERSVKMVIDNGKRGDNQRYDEFLNTIFERKIKHITTRRDDKIVGFEGVEIAILSPWKRLFSDDNNNSICLRITYGDVSFLFSGDMESAALSRLVAVDNVETMVIKVPHHGGIGSLCEEFIEEVHPKFAVISVGRNNRFGHPRPEVLDAYKQEGTYIYRTDKDGALTFQTDGRKLWIKMAGR